MAAPIRPARSLRRQWKLTAISVFSLTIAMALGVIALSLSNTVLLLGPSAPAPERLVTIYNRTAANPVEQVSYPDYEYYRQNSHIFTDIAAAPNSIGLNVDFNFGGREVKVVSRPVSENYFAVMGLRPYLGRFFAPGDDASKTHLAVMTWSCWIRLGADPNIIGKVVAGNTIIGVTPRSFTGAFYGLNGDLFTTFAQYDSGPWRTQRGARRLMLTARLKPGLTQQQAQTEMTALAGQLATAYPKEDNDRRAVVTRATLMPPDAMPTARLMIAILLGLVLLVLLIACANVANLLLAAAVGRRQEAAIKLALGASRGRLVREFLTESTILCAFSGLLAFGIAAWLIANYSDFTVVFPMFGSYSFALHLRLDAAVIAFTLVLMLIASAATGIAPALYASSPRLAQLLSGEIVVGGTRKAVRRNALVIVQIAVSTLVLVGMGLCQRNLYNLRHADLGFSARNLLGVTIYLEAEGYSETRGKAFLATLRRTLAALPGVETVSLAWDLPLLGTSQVPVELPDGGKKISVAHTVVDTDYFRTFGIRLLAGRAFTAADRDDSPDVAVINHKLAGMLWPGQDPLGKAITAGEPAHRYTVVGVAADGKYLDLDEPQRPFLYLNLSQNYRGGISVIARTKGDPRLWVQPLAKAMRGLGLKIMVNPVTFDEWMGLSLLTQRIAAACVAALSALGLGLAVIGLFGAVSYAVSERRRELGIRTALGARPGQLLQMILRQTLRIAGTGVLVGGLAGVVATTLLRSQFFGIGAVEWVVLLPVSATMLAVSLLVAYLSARPWVTVPPMDAVRHA
jgi:predicted permease